MTTNVPNLMTLRQFAKKHPAFPVGGVRHRLERQRESMESAGAILKIGNKLLIHEEKFFEWIVSGAAKNKAA